MALKRGLWAQTPCPREGQRLGKWTGRPAFGLYEDFCMAWLGDAVRMAVSNSSSPAAHVHLQRGTRRL